MKTIYEFLKHLWVDSLLVPVVAGLFLGNGLYSIILHGMSIGSVITFLTGVLLMTFRSFAIVKKYKTEMKDLNEK